MRMFIGRIMIKLMKLVYTWCQPNLNGPSLMAHKSPPPASCVSKNMAFEIIVRKRSDRQVDNRCTLVKLLLDGLQKQVVRMI